MLKTPGNHKSLFDISYIIATSADLEWTGYYELLTDVITVSLAFGLQRIFFVILIVQVNFRVLHYRGNVI